MRESLLGRQRPSHPYAWLWEPLEEEVTFLLRSMFGAKAIYIDGQTMLCFIAKEEPWRGVLICTEREHHDSLRADFSGVVPHPVLGKWLYLSESDADFETLAEKLVRAVRRRDPRIGIVPKPRRKRKGPGLRFGS